MRFHQSSAASTSITMKLMVVDIQGYNLPEFHPKEISFISGQQTAHYLLKPPFPSDTLNHQIQKQIHYLVNYHHGLKYSSGYINYDMLDDILRNHLLSGDVDMVYVKGHQKRRFLEDKICELTNSSSSTFTPDVINVEALLDEEENNTIPIPNFIKDIPYCFNHCNYNSVCSLRNCTILFNWVCACLPK